MKKCIYGFVTMFSVSIAVQAQSKTTVSSPKELAFEQAVTITIKDRVPLKTASKTLSAKAVQLVSNNKAFALPSAIFIEDVKLVDDGQDNDVKAGDGIYTSKGGYENLKAKFVSETIVFSSNTGTANLQTHGTVDCNIKYVYEIPYISCSIHVSW